MSRAAVAAGAYLALTAAYLYGAVDPGHANGAAWWPLLAAFALLHVLTGAYGRSVRLLFLPLGAIVLAVPAGLPETEGGEPFPLWTDLLLWAPFGAVLILTGWLVARRGTR